MADGESTVASWYRRFEAYITNTGWMVSNRVLALALKFLVVVVVSRYLGPENYGLLAYALSLTALFAILGHMGLSGLVVRELLAKPGETSDIMGTAFTMKCAGALIGYLALLLYASWFEGFSSTPFMLISIAGLVILLSPFRVVDLWFESKVKARFIAIASLVGLTTAACMKLLLVFAGGGILLLAATDVLQAAITITLLGVFFVRRSSLSFADFSFTGDRAMELLRSGWAVYLGSIFAVVYLKIDQVMLRWLVGVEEVGIYAVAAQLSEVWYFLPAAIVSSVFPALMRVRKKDESLFKLRFQQLLDILFLIAAAVALIISLLAEPLIALCFGGQYSASASVLVIHVWAAIFIFMRAAFSRWILIENVLIFSLVTQGMGAGINILLNYPLILYAGAKGAAWATLISYATASFLSLSFYRVTRPVFWCMLKAMVSPLRYPWYYLAKLR